MYFLLQTTKQVIYDALFFFHKLVKLILDKITLVDVLIYFWTKTCFLVHVTWDKRKRKKKKNILIWTMVFKEKKASVKGLIGIPWAFSGLCSSNSSPSQRGAAGTKEALSLATSLQLAQTCIVTYFWMLYARIDRNLSTWTTRRIG